MVSRANLFPELDSWAELRLTDGLIPRVIAPLVSANHTTIIAGSFITAHAKNDVG